VLIAKRADCVNEGSGANQRVDESPAGAAGRGPSADTRPRLSEIAYRPILRAVPRQGPVGAFVSQSELVSCWMSLAAAAGRLTRLEAEGY